MKYITLTFLIVLALSMTSCSLVADYLPTTNQTNETGILDDFNFTDVLTNETVDELPTDDDSQDVQPSDVVFATITAKEGDLVSLQSLKAIDPDGDAIAYSYGAPFNEAGLWQTNEGDEGKRLVAITATDGLLSITEYLQVIILPSNKAPVIDCPEFFIVSEGDLIDLPCTIYDIEGDEVTFAVSGFMNELTYQTTYGDAGAYQVVITATDGNKASVKEIDLIINKKNRAPVVEPIDVITVTEFDLVVIDVVASDPDGDVLTITYPLLFDDDGTWPTVRGDAGLYDLQVIVSDGMAKVVVPLRIVIEEINEPPLVESIEMITVKEGETIVIAVVASDPDGDELTIAFEGFMTSDTYTTTYDDAGEYEVLVIVSDGVHEVITTVDIVVEDVNRPPVFILN